MVTRLSNGPVQANKGIATPSPVAEDATFPDATPKTLDYSEAIAKAILSSECLAESISEDEAQSLASAICRNYAGCAPVIALHRLSDEAIHKAANARTPLWVSPYPDRKEDRRSLR
jgi:hypothetical protein